MPRLLAHASTEAGEMLFAQGFSCIPVSCVYHFQPDSGTCDTPTTASSSNIREPDLIFDSRGHAQRSFVGTGPAIRSDDAVNAGVDLSCSYHWIHVQITVDTLNFGAGHASFFGHGGQELQETRWKRSEETTSFASFGLISRRRRHYKPPTSSSPPSMRNIGNQMGRRPIPQIIHESTTA